MPYKNHREPDAIITRSAKFLIASFIFIIAFSALVAFPKLPYHTDLTFGNATVLALSLLFSAALSVPSIVFVCLARKQLGVKGILICLFCLILVILLLGTLTASTALLRLNYLLQEDGTPPEETVTATVEEVRHHRKGYLNPTPYYVYATLNGSGDRIRLYVTRSDYLRLHRGDRITVYRYVGALGVSYQTTVPR